MAKVKDWQCCLKRRREEITRFMAFASDRTVDFKLLFLISTWWETIFSYFNIATGPWISEKHYSTSDSF
jgi:hypothetical protein